MSKGNKEWPFKTIEQESSWPMHRLLCTMAAGIAAAPKELRVAMAQKTVERFFRLGAKLVREFNLNPATALAVCEATIVSECGPVALTLIATAKQDEYEAHLATAEGLTLEAFSFTKEVLDLQLPDYSTITKGAAS